MDRATTERRVDVGGRIMAVVDHAGDDPVVLALPGLGGVAREWDGLAAALPHRRVVAVDLRGHGASDWGGPYDLEASVGDLHTLLAVLGVGPVVAVGHSLGGAVAVALAAAHPVLVAGLVVVDLGPELPPEAQALRRSRGARPRSYATPDAAAAALRQDDAFASDDAIAHRVRHSFVPHPDGSGRWTWRHDPELDRTDAAALLAPQWGRWRATTAPALVVRGAASPYLGGDIATRMAEARPGVELAVVVDAGHNVPTDAPEAFGAVVGRWLDRIAPLGGTDRASAPKTR